MQRPWPLVKANGFILVSESVPGIISAFSKAFKYTKGSKMNLSHWNGYVTAVSFLQPPCGGFRSETATWIQKWFKTSVGASIIEVSRHTWYSAIIVFQGGGDGRGYRVVIKKCVKYPGGPSLIKVTEICNRFGSIQKRLLIRNPPFTSETAVRRFQKRNGHLDPGAVYNKKSFGVSRKLYWLYIYICSTRVFQYGCDGHGYRYTFGV
jgi:hypothetical protein